MKQNQKGFGVVEIIVILLATALIVGAAFYLLKGRTRVSISNEGRSFSFDLGVPAKAVTRSSQGKTSEYFQATPKDSATLIATVYKPTSSSADLKNSCKYEKLDATILSRPHTICDQQHKVFIANFNDGDTWYQVAVFPEDIKSELKSADVIRLVESIRTD